MYDNDRPWSVSNKRADSMLAKFMDELDARAEAKAGPTVDVDAMRDRQRGPGLREDGSFDPGHTSDVKVTSIDDKGPSVPWRQ